MLELENALRELNDADRALLCAYSTAEAAACVEPRHPSEADGEAGDRRRWIARLRDIEGLAREDLAPTHGRMIAAGFLQFQLEDRNNGLAYRLSPEGRAALVECRSGNEAA